MRYSFSFLEFKIILVSLMLSVSSCSKEIRIKNDLVGLWNLDIVYQKGRDVTKQFYEFNYTLLLESNQHFTLYMDSQKILGEWQYSRSKNQVFLTNENGFEKTFNFVNIDAYELVLSEIVDDNLLTVMYFVRRS
ncbi:MAG: hypothetical protein M0R38_08950 [Bacteroidia bacterium]|nr:hypothetical protein [Bacteroidia bacterium]